jgi:acetyl-CoA carboxylase alpha subunit
VSDDCPSAAIAEGECQSERVAYGVQETKRPQVRIVIGTPASGAAVATQVRSDDVKAGSGHSRHHLAPGISHLRKAVQHQHQRAARTLKASFKDMDSKTVDVIDEPRTDAGRQYCWVERVHRSIELNISDEGAFPAEREAFCGLQIPNARAPYRT